MPNVSQRGIDMPASPIRRLVPLADEARRRGVKVYSLNIGQPDIPTPREAFDALKKIDRKVLEYSPSAGLMSLREKLRGYYKKYNIDVDVDDIIVTCGGSEAVLFAFMACLDPGDEIIVPEPAYANYMAFAISAGAKIVTIPSSIDEGFALPPDGTVRRAYHSENQGNTNLQPEQPDGLPLFDEGDAAATRHSEEARSLPVFRRGLPRVLLHGGALHLRVPSARD